VTRMFRERLTYANVVATIALFLGLGGAAVAATNALLDQKDSVTARHIAPNAVRKSELAGGAVGKSELAPKLQSQLSGTSAPIPDGNYVGTASPYDSDSVPFTITVTVQNGEPTDIFISSSGNADCNALHYTSPQVSFSEVADIWYVIGLSSAHFGAVLSTPPNSPGQIYVLELHQVEPQCATADAVILTLQ
jgi:hypothetical protein